MTTIFVLVVESVLEMVRGSTIVGDKGFIGEDWQAQLQERTGNRLWTVKRKKQLQQHLPELHRLIGKVRQRIEGVFHEIQSCNPLYEGDLALIDDTP